MYCDWKYICFTFCSWFRLFQLRARQANISSPRGCCSSFVSLSREAHDYYTQHHPSSPHLSREPYLRHSPHSLQYSPFYRDRVSNYNTIHMIILEYKYSHEEHGLLRSVQCLCGSVSCSTNLRQHDDDVDATKDTLW